MNAEIEIVDEPFVCGANKEGHRRKREWLEQNYPLGLKCNVLRFKQTGEWIGMIEYMPGEFAWRAVDAKNYMVIHCIMVVKKHSGQGYGSLLIQECIQDAKKQAMDGVVVLATEKTWCADSRIYVKNGFEVVDSAPPAFKLHVNRFGDAEFPSLGNWKQRLEEHKAGVFMFYSKQCPFMRGDSLRARQEWLKSEYGIEAKVFEIADYKAAQANPCVWGTYGMVCNGVVINYVPGGNSLFMKSLKRLKIIPQIEIPSVKEG